MSRCIITLATTLWPDNDVYIRAQERLLSSAKPYDVPVLYWTDAYPPGSPTHQESPYAFKPSAFKHAAEQGYTSILWCDANVWLRGDPAPVFDIMEREGHALFYNGWNCGQWCTDAALSKHGLSRDEAMNIPDFTGCCMGLNLKHDRSRELLRRWHDASLDGVSFQGAWRNDQGQCSSDPRCMGHRHDQVIGSILADRLGMPLIGPLPWFSYWNRGGIPESVLLVNGR